MAKKTSGGTATPVAVDPFADIGKLRLAQNFADTVGVRKILNHIPVRKPGAQDFVRVNTDPAYRGNFPIIELKEDRETFLVMPDMAMELVGEIVPVTLYLAINRQGVVFIWPARLPGEDGKVNVWHTSSHDAAELAMKHWLRVKANMNLGSYEMFKAEGVIQEPTWPVLPFNELLRIAFKDRLVDSVDHPVVKRFRGIV